MDPQPAGARSAPHVRQFLFLYALAAWIAFVAIRIEMLNAASGYRLSGMSEALAQNRADGGRGKWRAMRMTESLWRRYHRDDKGDPVTRPLTPEETARMAADIERENANYRLRQFVSIFGWMQYLLAAAAGATAVVLAVENRRRPGLAAAYALPVTVAAAALGLAVYRGYFTSTFG